MPRSAWFSAVMPLLLAKQAIPAELMSQIIEILARGEFDPVEAAAWLVALRAKGETGEELAAAVQALRTFSVPFSRTPRKVLDTCGTGGDESGTFNISTAVSLVVAGCGVPVVKHGNRAVSSRSGSADVLRELGVPIEAGAAWSMRCLRHLGFAFCYAPHFHPALASVATLRRKLGFRTLFNLLGPLLNPAGAEYQLIGVGKAELLHPLAEATRNLGIQRALLVHSHDGLDEVSLAAPTRVLDVHDGTIREFEWTHEQFGLPQISLADVRADGSEQSARMIADILQGKPGPACDIVLANTATALLVTGAVKSLPEGVERARESIKHGSAWQILQELRNSVPMFSSPETAS